MSKKRQPKQTAVHYNRRASCDRIAKFRCKYCQTVFEEPVIQECGTGNIRHPKGTMVLCPTCGNESFWYQNYIFRNKCERCHK